MSHTMYRLHDVPSYLQDAFNNASQSQEVNGSESVNVLSLDQVQELSSQELRHAHLLLLRHHLTKQIANSNVLHPPMLIERSRVYEVLGYADLAVADAFVAYTLCETIRSEEWVSDLEPQDLSGDEWLQSDQEQVLPFLIEALSIVCRSLISLGATKDAGDKTTELEERYCDLYPDKETHEIEEAIRDLLEAPFSLLQNSHTTRNTSNSRFGLSHREVYQWNEHEPDRSSTESVSEINHILRTVAPELEARIAVLPALDNKSDVWRQLGLFARTDLPPEMIILREKSLLTAIRPLEDALCDACGADLESSSREDMRKCSGDGCDLTFCSDECASRASLEYHKPNLDAEDDDDDEDYPPADTPFCGNTALHEIGRTSSTDTPEWDLYFLLLTRTIQMSVTRGFIPLDLPEIKYLWGDFDNAPDGVPSLPFSLYHNVALPLQFFETLMHSLPAAKPYTTAWFANFDWWILQTLYAKFRGVANAQQSSYDGKPEIAAVHPMWCLANHSCSPNVRWSPTGVREFRVLTGKELVVSKEKNTKWSGIKADEEIWSHYTDVRLSVTERRQRLQEVLGGTCRCERCVLEAREK